MDHNDPITERMVCELCSIIERDLVPHQPINRARLLSEINRCLYFTALKRSLTVAGAARLIGTNRTTFVEGMKKYCETNDSRLILGVEAYDIF